jgi:hypothetical protein
LEGIEIATGDILDLMTLPSHIWQTEAEYWGLASARGLRVEAKEVRCILV